MDSHRLPGKLLCDVGGIPLVEYVLRRAGSISPEIPVVLATTRKKTDDLLVRTCAKLGIETFRGAYADVAARLLTCAHQYQADWVIRANGDSPFLDPTLIRDGLQRLGNHADLVSNVPGRTFPYGISVEIIRVTSLETAWPGMMDVAREHVTAHFYDHSDRFQIVKMVSSRPDLATQRMVVDIPDDLERLRKVVTILGDSATTAGFVEAAEAYRQISEAK